MNTDILIKQYCKELRLGMNIYENYSKIKATDYADFLAQLLKMEVEHREIVRKNRNLKTQVLMLSRPLKTMNLGKFRYLIVSVLKK